MDERLEKAWADFLKDFDDAVTDRIEQQQAAGLIKPFDARPVAIALNRMDAYLLIQHFGRRPRGNQRSVREAILRVWISTLYGDKPLAESVPVVERSDTRRRRDRKTVKHTERPDYETYDHHRINTWVIDRVNCNCCL